MFVFGNYLGVVYIDMGMKFMSGMLCLDSCDWYEELFEKGLKFVFV